MGVALSLFIVMPAFAQQPGAGASDMGGTVGGGGLQASQSASDAASPRDDAASARLRIEGAITDASGTGYIDLDWETLKQLTPHKVSTSTVVTDGVLLFEGVLMRSLMDYVGAHGQTVTARALNGYEVDIPTSDFEDFDVLLAWSANGQRLQAVDKGPFWIIYPRDQHDVLQDIRYDYRWVWQLVSLRVN